MRDLSKVLVVLGAILIIVGLAFTYAGRLDIGRLPGDFVYRRGNFSLYLPLATSILLSFALTVILWLFRR